MEKVCPSCQHNEVCRLNNDRQHIKRSLDQLECFAFACAEMRNNIKALWKKACAFDHIPTDSKFVEFSKENPYMKDYNKAILERQQKRQKQKIIRGKITGFDNQGTIVILTIERDNITTMIPFDHRMFQHFVESNPNLKIGDTLEYNMETNTVTLEDVQQ